MGAGGFWPDCARSSHYNPLLFGHSICSICPHAPYASRQQICSSPFPCFERQTYVIFQSPASSFSKNTSHISYPADPHAFTTPPFANNLATSACSCRLFLLLFAVGVSGGFDVSVVASFFHCVLYPLPLSLLLWGSKLLPCLCVFFVFFGLNCGCCLF